MADLPERDGFQIGCFLYGHDEDLPKEFESRIANSPTSINLIVEIRWKLSISKF